MSTHDKHRTLIEALVIVSQGQEPYGSIPREVRETCKNAAEALQTHVAQSAGNPTMPDHYVGDAQGRAHDQSHQSSERPIESPVAWMVFTSGPAEHEYLVFADELVADHHALSYETEVIPLYRGHVSATPPSSERPNGRFDELPDIIHRARAIDEARNRGDAFGKFPPSEALALAWAVRVLADREAASSATRRSDDKAWPFPTGFSDRKSAE